MKFHPFSSKIIADVGISFGDEGKGRLIYEVIDELRTLTEKPASVAAVLKVNGGANAGHTAGGLKLNLLPSGIVDSSIAVLAIGSGVVADPRKFWWEIKPLESRGYNVLNRLKIDERTQVSDLSHRLLDLAWENYRVNQLKEPARGSTAKGISPAYMDEVGQWQIFYTDFRGDKDIFVQKMHQRIERALSVIKHVCKVSAEDWDGFFSTLTDAEMRANSEAINDNIFPASEFDFFQFKGTDPYSLNMDTLIDCYWEQGKRLAETITDIREVILQALQQEHYILGEFGQSYWLDKRQGFPPNVTASHSYTPEFFQSAGIPIQPIHTIGVCKAYDTKVGTHHFITEMNDKCPLTSKLKQMEYGTSTGRQRKVGWFDAVEKGSVLRYGGFQDLAINKLDALTCSGPNEGIELLICTAYRDADGNLYHQVPRDDKIRSQLQPVYLQLPSWKEDISHTRHFTDLPLAAQHYVAVMVNSLLKVAFQGNPLPEELPPVHYLGVGPERTQIIKDTPPTAALIKMAENR